MYENEQSYGTRHDTEVALRSVRVAIVFLE